MTLNWLIGQGKQEIEYLCNKHISFEKVKVEVKLSNELSQELGYDLKDIIIAEYQNYLDSHSTDEITTAIISKIERSVELQTWSNGIVNMQEAIKLLVERVKNSSRSYGNLYTAPISENDILEKFNKATENTLLERIQGNKIDDNIELYVKESGNKRYLWLATRMGQPVEKGNNPPGLEDIPVFELSE